MSSMEKKWLADIPSQFRGQPNISAFISAFSKQLDEVTQMMTDVTWMTDLDSAEGKNLDRIGEIVNITRQEAYQLLDPNTISVIDDDIFRAVLRFKILKNNTDGTYKDIMKGLHYLWDYRHADLTYEENPWDEERNRKAPATLLLGVNDIPSDAIDPLIVKPMVIKPGGVKIDFTVSYRDDMQALDWEKFTNIRISVENNFFYDGAYYDSVGGKLYYDGTIEYHPDKYNYNYFDGTYQYNGEIYWGPIVEDYEVYEMDATFLKQAKRKTLRLRALGATDSWRIKYMVWGDGLSSSGNPYTPDEDQTELKHELLRKECSVVYKETEYSWTYYAYIGDDELVGNSISEVGLADSDGMLICVKTFPKKYKVSGRQMTFKIDDTLVLE